MNELNKYIEKIKMLQNYNKVLLRAILQKLKLIINGKRKLMYSDVINLIIRDGCKGDDYNQLILWCNYKIRIGEIFIEFE